MSKLSRTKGAAFERELSIRWRESGLFPDARRNLSQSRSAAREGGDILGTGEWHVEAKHHARPQPLAALAQAIADANGKPAVVVTNARGKLAVTMTLEVFEALLARRGP